MQERRQDNTKLLKMYNDLDKRHEVMCNKIEHINQNIDDIKEYIQEDRRWKEEFSKLQDKRFAGKWVEAIAIGTLIALLAKLFTTNL